MDNSQFINKPNSAGMLWDPNFQNWYPSPGSSIYNDLTSGLSKADIEKYTKGTYAYTQAHPTLSLTPYNPAPTPPPTVVTDVSSENSFGPLFVVFIVLGGLYLVLKA